MSIHSRSHRRFYTGLLAAAVVVAPTSLLALGFALPDQDAFATSRGNAFVATADDPAAVFYNPAGLTQLQGSHMSIGAYGIGYGASYNGPRGDINSKEQLAVLPQVFSSLSLSNYNLTFGLGTYSAFGLRNEWPATAPFTAEGETGEIDYTTINPVIAYHVLPSLSIAAGPTFSYSEADFKEYIAPINFINHFRGRDTSAGFNAGVLWQPFDEHSFGATYRSANDMNYNGHATSLTGPGNIPAQANIHFPQTLVLGYSYRPTTDWNFEFDASWADWTDLRTVNVFPQQNLGDKLDFDYHPSMLFEFGATRYLCHGWRVSGGYMYSMNTVPTADFNALVPDQDRHIFSIGLGKRYGQFSWDVAYQLVWGPERTVSGDNFAPANGKYDFLGNAISVNVGYHF